MQHVVAAFELARGFDADDVVRLFHDANHRGSPVGSRQYWQSSLVADVIADAAKSQLVLDVENGLSEVLGVVTAGAQHLKGHALRGLLPDAGKRLNSVMRRASGSAKSGIV
jgi:hypothetical protein